MNVLDAVIDTIQRQEKELASVSLEEAKQLTLDIMKTRRRLKQATNPMTMPHALDRFVDPATRIPRQPIHLVRPCSASGTKRS